MKKSRRTPDQENELISLLFKRQAELNSLLELSRLIQADAPVADLLEMLHVILKLHLQVQVFQFFQKQEHGFGYLSGFGSHLQLDFLEESALLSTRICPIADLASEVSAKLVEFDYYVPLVKNEQVEAFAVLCSTGSKIEVIQHDLHFLQSLLHQLMVALENKQLQAHKLEKERLEQEIRLGREVQQMLIPQFSVRNDQVEMVASYYPHDQLGGDYFDFLKLSAEEWMWCIADVSGKGLAAALLMANLQASLRACLSISHHPKQVVHHLNDLMWMTTQGDRYITLFLGIYHAPSKCLRYVNAGHQPPILVRSQEQHILTRGTVMLGAFDELPFIEMGEEQLVSGDLIFNYTDGLTDFPYPQQILHEQDLIEFILPNRQLPLQQLHESVLHQLTKISQQKSFTDDLTLLSVNIK